MVTHASVPCGCSSSTLSSCETCKVLLAGCTMWFFVKFFFPTCLVLFEVKLYCKKKKKKK